VESIYPTPPELSEAIISAALSAFGSSPPVYLTSVRGSACAARNVSHSAITLRLVRKHHMATSRSDTPDTGSFSSPLKNTTDSRGVNTIGRPSHRLPPCPDASPKYTISCTNPSNEPSTGSTRGRHVEAGRMASCEYMTEPSRFTGSSLKPLAK
jgi:hypothetical protein